MATATDNETVLFCESSPFLTLGPGEKDGEDVLHFINGYATISGDDPRHDEKLAWAKRTGEPRIEILTEADRGRIVPALVQGHQTFPCTDCGLRLDGEPNKTFDTQKALNMHRIAVHRPK